MSVRALTCVYMCCVLKRNNSTPNEPQSACGMSVRILISMYTCAVFYKVTTALCVRARLEHKNDCGCMHVRIHCHCHCHSIFLSMYTCAVLRKKRLRSA